MRSALIVIGILALVLASRAKVSTPQEANDVVLEPIAVAWNREV